MESNRTGTKRLRSIFGKYEIEAVYYHIIMKRLGV